MFCRTRRVVGVAASVGGMRSLYSNRNASRLEKRLCVVNLALDLRGSEMRVISVETMTVRIPLKPERRMISALGRHEVSEFVLVRLQTDEGIEGVGEATVTPRWSGETRWSAQAMIAHVIAPVIMGVDPKDIAEIESRLDAVAVGNWFAKAAVEMACWDIVGRAAGKPVFELLGGACRPLTIRNRFSLGAYEPALAAERAKERVASGFTTIKVKVGTELRADVARVRAVRDAIGSDIELTIDANGGWSESAACECLSALADCNIRLVEQPLVRGNYTGLKRLRERMGCKIIADESCFDEVEAAELIAQNCCDVLSIYPGKQGGIARARRIAEMAGEHGVACTIGSNLEWDIAARAMMHFIVATPNMRVDVYPGDCLGPFYHEFSIAQNPLVIEGPFTTLNVAPGLGVDVDWDRVKTHRID